MEFMKVYADSLTNKFDSAYRAKCMQAYLYEQFTVTHNVSEYHHTLYYYDQAGNLLKTVPPSGVHANYDPVWLDNVAAARNADQSLVPAHGLNTQYRYNTLNQVVTQQTPDAGQSRFWYDRLGRLAISQNARQKYVSTGEQGRQYSYTLYDYIGRITEVGQIANAGTAPMTDSISRVEGNLLSWITASQVNKEQITQTVYDAAYAGFTGLSFTPLVQRNLRNRVSYTSFTVGSNPAQYNQGTFYTYDIEGNVDTLLQDYGSSTFSSAQNVMNLNGNRFKRLVYQYDLVSGKVNNVAYQPHQVDAFYHRYSYDAENRITLAETSADSVHWDKEARYEYYKHGPLARVIMGDKMVQGLDYAYTLQGWLKGVNSTSLLPGFDMGRDGDTTYRNRYIAKDIYGFSLNYFAGDYAAIGTGVTPFPGSSAALSSSYRPLFNGNISSMAVNLGPLYRNQHGPADTSHWRGPLLYNYRYDQLNRITGMDAFYGLNQPANSWAGLMPTADFRERVAYDGNGNIQQYKRNNFGETGLPMDSLGYKYIAGTNKLSWIRDSADDAVGGGYDLHNQPVGNYAYDSIGNLIKDSVERISAIKWNVYGKIIEIDHRSTTAANPTKNIYYYYDAAGNRIGKKVTRGDTSAATYTWYVRDASGNVMSTYTASLDTNATSLGNADLQLNEQHIYGSSRLGVLTANRTVDANTEGLNNYVSPWTGLHLPWYTGRKQYELANHLGNVLATISDKKIGVSLAADSSLIDHYEADVKTAQDYYPFGMIMPGRMLATLSIPGGSFSGTTTVNGYTLPVDLTLNGRTDNQPTSYVATDLIDLNDGFESGTNDDVTAYIADGSYAGGGNGSNDNAVAGGGYRYGFNGKENDNEVKGVGDQIDYGMRVYDPRVGKFLSIDPYTKQYPHLTPYQFAGNKPIWAIDIDGLEESYYSGQWNAKTGKIEFHLDKVVSQKSFLGFKYKPSEEIIVTMKRSDGDETKFSFTPNGHLVRNFGIGERVNKITEFEAFKQSSAENIYSSEEQAMHAFDGANVGGFYSKGALSINFFGNICRDFYDHGGAYTLNANIRTSTQATAAHSSEETTASTSKNLKVTTYEEAVKDNVGQGLNADHIPSYASLVKAEEARLNRPLSTPELRVLRNKALTLTIDADLHRSTSETYGGRNNATRQQQDANNPIQAIRSNVNRYRDRLLKEGYTNQEIDRAIDDLSKPFIKNNASTPSQNQRQ